MKEALDMDPDRLQSMGGKRPGVCSRVQLEQIIEQTATVYHGRLAVVRGQHVVVD